MNHNRRSSSGILSSAKPTAYFPPWGVATFVFLFHTSPLVAHVLVRCFDARAFHHHFLLLVVTLMNYYVLIRRQSTSPSENRPGETLVIHSHFHVDTDVHPRPFKDPDALFG